MFSKKVISLFKTLAEMQERITYLLWWNGINSFIDPDSNAEGSEWCNINSNPQ